MARFRMNPSFAAAAFEAARRLDKSLAAPAAVDVVDAGSEENEQEPADAHVWQNAELLSLILQAAASTSSSGKRNVTARTICSCESVCRSWRECVRNEKLWQGFAEGQWKECAEIVGVASWKHFSATRLALSKPRVVLHRESDLQLMLTVKLMIESAGKRSGETRRSKERTLLSTVLPGRSARWSDRGFFQWRDLPVKLPKRLAAEAEAHGWYSAGPAAHDDTDVPRGLGAMLFDERLNVLTEHSVQLSLTAFRASDQKMLRLFSSDACELECLRSEDCMRWHRGVGSGLVLLDARLELQRDAAPGREGEPVRWRFALGARDAEDEEEDDYALPQSVLKVLNSSLAWTGVSSCAPSDRSRTVVLYVHV